MIPNLCFNVQPIVYSLVFHYFLFENVQLRSLPFVKILLYFVLIMAYPIIEAKSFMCVISYFSYIPLRPNPLTGVSLRSFLLCCDLLNRVCHTAVQYCGDALASHLHVVVGTLIPVVGEQPETEEEVYFQRNFLLGISLIEFLERNIINFSSKKCDCFKFIAHLLNDTEVCLIIFFPLKVKPMCVIRIIKLNHDL